MKLTVDSKMFAEHLTNVMPALGKSSSLPIIENVHMSVTPEGEKEHSVIVFTTTNLNITIKSAFVVDEKLDAENFVFEPKQVTELIGNLNEEKLTFTFLKKKMKIETGFGNEFEFPLFDPETFPSIDIDKIKKSPNKFSVSAKVFQDLIKRTKMFASSDEARPVLESVLLEGAGETLIATATDASVLVSLKKFLEGSAIPEINVKLDPNIMMGLELIPKDKDIEIFFTDNKTLVSSPTMAIHGVNMEGKYPEYRNVIPTASPKVKFTATKYDLKKAVRIMTTFVNVETKAFVITVNEEGLLFSSADKDRGKKASYKVPATDVEIDGEEKEVEIAFNARRFKILLDAIDQGSVTFKGTPGKACLLQAGEKDDVYLIMPVMIQQ